MVRQSGNSRAVNKVAICSSQTLQNDSRLNLCMPCRLNAARGPRHLKKQLLAVALGVGLPLMAVKAAESEDKASRSWYRNLTGWIKPAWDWLTPRRSGFRPFWEESEMGPASVYRPRTGRRGVFYRSGGAESVELDGLPDLSPDVRVPGYSWTSDTALSRALVANPDIAAARYALLRQEGLEMDSRSRRLPQVSVTGAYEVRESRLIDRAPVFSPTAVASKSHDVRIELRQMLFDGGASANALKRERLQTLMMRYSLQLAAYRTAALVKQGYDAVLLRQDMVNHAVQKETSLRQIADFAARRFALGSMSELDSLRARTELKLAEADTWKARSGLLQAKVYLAQQMYLPLTEDRLGDFTVTGELVPRDFTLPPAEAVALALERRLDLLAGSLQVKAAGHALQAIRSDLLPKLEVFANYGFRSSYYEENPQREGWTGGVAGRWSIFDGFGVKGRTRAYRADQRAAQARLDDLEVQVRTGLTELFGALQLGRTAVTAQTEAAALSEKSLSYARRAYELGQATLEQVLESETVLLRSRNARGDAILALNATVAQLEFSVGGVLPGERDVGIEVMP